MARTEKDAARDQLIGMAKEVFTKTLEGKLNEVKALLHDMETLCDHIIRIERRAEGE